MLDEDKEQQVTEQQIQNGLELVQAYQGIVMNYQSAIDEVETKLRIIDRELNTKETIGRNNTIHHIGSRVKSLGSITKKLAKRGVEFSLENAEEELGDIAGIRVICAYQDDIYLVLDSLSRQSDVTIMSVKDYIKEPKPSGYRSVHVVLEIPVYFLEEMKLIKVEVQFRTIAMDYWSSLEHGLKYKTVVPDGELSERLVATARVIQSLEEEMLAIRLGIEGK